MSLEILSPPHDALEAAPFRAPLDNEASYPTASDLPSSVQGGSKDALFSLAFAGAAMHLVFFHACLLQCAFRLRPRSLLSAKDVTGSRLSAALDSERKEEHFYFVLHLSQLRSSVLSQKQASAPVPSALVAEAPRNESFRLGLGLGLGGWGPLPGGVQNSVWGAESDSSFLMAARGRGCCFRSSET